MSTRGWVTVNVFWLINKEINEEQQTIPFTGTQNLKLSPFASAILAKQERDSAPASVHNYDDKTGENNVKMHCGVVDTVGLIKKAIQEEYLRTPIAKHLRMRMVRTGSIVPDETPLCDILARTTAAWNVDFVLESSDPGRLPITIKPTNYLGNDVIIDEPGDIAEEEIIYPSYDPESKILSIQITNEKGESKVVTIKMIHDTSEKPFLGGHKIMPQDIEYHHAQTQTLFLTRTWSEKFKESQSRGVQTNPACSKYCQSSKEISTQTQVPGIYISCRDDKIIIPSDHYETSVERGLKLVEAATKIQIIFRRYLAKKEAKLEMLALLEGSSLGSIEEEAAAMTATEAKSKQDFQRLYAQLEGWRVKEEKQISGSKTGYALRRARSKLVSDEALKLAHLASNRDEHKIAEKHEVVRNIIFKAGQPRMWFNSAGKMLQWESPGTTRAQELAEIYRMLEIDEEVEGDDRVPGLAALKAKLNQMEPCPLITELYSLALREEQLIRRGVRATYLTGLRLRIITTYLQLIRTPEHNPEITRFENQLPIPVLHTAIPRERKRGATEFCLSCRNYLTRTKFSLSSGTVGRCSNCEQLDNDARSRQDLSVYKSMLDRIKHDEESRNNTTSPIFQLQDSDIRYIVRSFWDSRSILSGLSNMYELRLIRWIHDEEWSPWNCILLTHNEADIHGQLSNLFKAYGPLLVQKIRHKHTLARNHFSKMSTMANYFKGQSDDQSQTDQISQTGEEDEEHSFTNELSHSLSCSISVKD